MKICILTTSYPRFSGDSAGIFVHNLTKELVKNGIKVKVVAPHDTNTLKYEIMDDVEIYRFRYMFSSKLEKMAYHGGIPHNLRTNLFSKVILPIFMLSFFIKSIRVAKKCDIVHTQWMFSGFIGSFIKRFLGKPVILTILGSGVALFQNKSKKIKKILSRILSNIDLVTTAYEYEKNMIKANFNLKKLDVIPMGVDTKKFHYNIPNSKLKKSKNFENNYVIINTRSLSKGYHVETFIKSIPYIIKEIQNVKFLLPATGPEINEMQELINNLNIGSYVTISGGVSHDEMPEYFAMSDIYVDTAFHPGSELRLGIGQATREAMSCGLPLLLPDWIPNESDISNYAIFYKTNDPKSLANKTIMLLRDKDLRQKLGKNSREAIEKSHDNNMIIKKWIKTYEDLLS